MNMCLPIKNETQIHEDIVLTEIDIENLIRTKGSIYAGCKILLESVGLGFKDLEQIIIAGGFGRHLDLEKAIFIGLLPEIDDRQIHLCRKRFPAGRPAAFLFPGSAERNGKDFADDDQSGIEQPWRVS